MAIAKQWKIIGASAVAVGFGLGGAFGVSASADDQRPRTIALQDVQAASAHQDLAGIVGLPADLGAPSSYDSPFAASVASVHSAASAPSPDSPASPASAPSPASPVSAPSPLSPPSPQSPPSPDSPASPQSPPSPDSPASPASVDSADSPD